MWESGPPSSADLSWKLIRHGAEPGCYPVRALGHGVRLTRLPPAGRGDRVIVSTSKKSWRRSSMVERCLRAEVAGSSPVGLVSITKL